MAASVKLDDELKIRIQRLAKTQNRTAHWIMREAIRDYVEREEAREVFKQEALAPATAALEMSISCLYQAISGKAIEQVDLSIIEQQIVTRFELSSELMRILASLREGSDLHQAEAMTLLKHLLQTVDEQLLSRLLP